MKIMATLKYGLIAVFILAYSQMSAFAFQDLSEPDDRLEQAHLILVGDKVRHQHTLHSWDDVDWFKFYAVAEISYEIIARYVGSDIDVVLELYDMQGNPLLTKPQDERFEGEGEMISWQASSDGFYAVKVSDNLPESEQCRQNSQYELRVARTDAPIFSGVITGSVIDALSGKPIDGAILFRHCLKQRVVPSFEDGRYSLDTCAGLSELTVKADGYQTLNCHVHLPEKFTLSRNIPLLPNGAVPPAPLPSQTIYHLGDTLHIAFQSIGLPPQSCIRYYFAIIYPDARAFFIPDLNRFEAFNPDSIPNWRGNGKVLIDKPIGDEMPGGEYYVYLLRLPEGIDEPLKHINENNLNVALFRIER